MCIYKYTSAYPHEYRKNWFLYFYVSDTHWKNSVCLLFMAMFELVWKLVYLLLNRLLSNQSQCAKNCIINLKIIKYFKNLGWLRKLKKLTNSHKKFILSVSRKRMNKIRAQQMDPNLRRDKKTEFFFIPKLRKSLWTWLSVFSLKWNVFFDVFTFCVITTCQIQWTMSVHTPRAHYISTYHIFGTLIF